MRGTWNKYNSDNVKCLKIIVMAVQKKTLSKMIRVLLSLNEREINQSISVLCANIFSEVGSWVAAGFVIMAWSYEDQTRLCLCE